MEVRGRNGKWLGTGCRGAVQVVGVDIISQFSPGIAQVQGGVNAFVVIDVIDCCAHYKGVRGKNSSGSGRRPVNGEERANSGELAADFFFLNVEEARDVLNYLLIGES